MAERVYRRLPDRGRLVRESADPTPDSGGWSQIRWHLVGLYRWVIQWLLLTGNSRFTRVVRRAGPAP